MIFGNLYALGTQVTLVSDIFRVLSFFLDGIIYSLIPTVFNMIYSLYDFSVLFEDGAFLTDLINRMSNTIYSFIAIFMFFRVAFSLLTMLVDPSVIDDKEKGAKKIVVNIMISLLLIVVVPIVFQYAKEIQSKAMSEHWIEKIIIGEEFSEDSEYSFGNEFALSVWGVFFSPFDANSTTQAAYDSLFNNQDAVGVGAVWPLTRVMGVLNSVVGVPIIADLVGRVPIFNNILNTMDAGTYYQLSYVCILSTIVGFYVLWTFVKLMIDVAYRSIKFFALELLSPIAIVSYIDPSSGKKGLFSKWMNETVKTYISLFIRIFVFALCSVLLRAFSLSNFDMSEKGFVKLFYVLAIIAFIKNAPKFIDGLFGTSISKDSDTKFVSDMFRGVLGGVATLAGGAITGAHVAGKVGESRLKGAWKGATSNWKKGYDTAKKGGLGALPGVVSAATYGAYTGAKKQYGYENDKEMQKLIDSLERKVPAIDEAKSGAVDELMANDREKYNQILEKGTKVNGRKYGRGLEKDDALENMLKKNAGGLAKDEVLHAGDNEYLERRRFVADRKQAEAIMSRTNAIAKAQYSSAVDAYNSSNDKNAYLISFEMGTAKNDFGRMDESGLKDAVTNELQKFIQTGRLQFNNADMSGKMDLVIENTNLDRAVVQNMSETELKVEYDKAIIEKANNSLSKFESADSIEAKTSIALDIKRDNITYEISGLSGANLTDRFNDANDARIVSNFGHSLDNIEADATKVSGEVKDAQAALDEYLKSGNGKKAKRLDSAYSLADSAYKAKKLAREQREEAARNNANNNNNNN